MKKLTLLALGIAILPLTVRADGDLGTTMKAMLSDILAVRKQISNPALNQATIKSIADFEAQVKTARSQVPATATTAQGLKDFQDLMDDMISHAEDMQTKLAQNDNAGAKADLNAIFADEQNGHGEFRPKN